MPLFRKSSLQEMEPWFAGFAMEGVSISQADKDNGSPRIGDMIAVNPYDRSDMWLVSEEFFKEHYEPFSD